MADDMTAAARAPSEEPVVEEAAPSLVNRTVGRYQVRAEIAKGGMGSVYLARLEGPSGFRKLVALKTIHPHLSSERRFVEMFFDEAAIAARIEHPNVCSVIDFGESDGTHFIAMEFLAGKPLNRIVKRCLQSDLDPKRHAFMIARVIADACEGLHAAHELRNERGERLNVVHRDISPDNIFVTYDGVAKITDFGIARARDRVHKTDTGQIKGKSGYMSPEHLQGQAMDRRSDVWAMGVVLWELLTLRRLFRRETASQTLLAVLTSAVLPPSEIRPGLPEAFDEVSLQALVRNPDERFPDARTLGVELRRLLRDWPEPLGAPEVAAWVAELFPSGETEHRRLCEQATDSARPPPNIRPVAPGVATTPHLSAEMPSSAPNRRPIAFLAIVLTSAGLAAGVAWGMLSWSSSPGPTPMAVLDSDPPPEPSIPAPEPSPPSPAPAEDPAPSVPEEEPREAATTSRTPNSRTRRARTARPRGRGFVNVVARGGGWARVYHGGRARGETPLRLELPAGRQTLEIRPLGRTPGRRVRVTIRPGEIVVLPVDTTP